MNLAIAVNAVRLYPAINLLLYFTNYALLLVILSLICTIYTYHYHKSANYKNQKCHQVVFEIAYIFSFYIFLVYWLFIYFIMDYSNYSYGEYFHHVVIHLIPFASIQISKILTNVRIIHTKILISVFVMTMIINYIAY